MKLKNKKIIVVGLGLNGSCVVDKMLKSGAEVIAIDKNNFLNNKLLKKNFLIEDFKFFLTLKFFLKKVLFIKSINYENPVTLRINRLLKRNKIEVINKNQEFANYEFNAINGKANIWGRISPRYPREYFDIKKKLWPLSYGELIKHYAKIEKKLILTGKKEFHTSFNGQIMIKKIFTNFFNKIKNKLLSDSIFSNFFIAPTLEYSSIIINPFLKKNLNNKKLKILTNSIVTNINCITPNEINSVEIYDKIQHIKISIKADYVFICSSPIETVKLLLNSKSKNYKKGLGNNSGMVGQKFNDHISVNYVGILNLFKKINFDLIPYHPTKKLMSFYLLINEKKIKKYLKFIVHGSISVKHKLINLYSFSESDTKNQNCIYLSNKKDIYGCNEIKIKFYWSKLEKRTWNFQKKIINKIVKTFSKSLNTTIFQKKNDFKNFINLPLPGRSYHESGGAIMGYKKSNSVVDNNCKVWGIKNLYICNMSIFPSLSSFNPTLTSLAITDRATDSLKNIK